MPVLISDNILVLHTIPHEIKFNTRHTLDYCFELILSVY